LGEECEIVGLESIESNFIIKNYKVEKKCLEACIRQVIDIVNMRGNIEGKIEALKATFLNRNKKEKSI
jgi:hypothetical protein